MLKNIKVLGDQVFMLSSLFKKGKVASQLGIMMGATWAGQSPSGWWDWRRTTDAYHQESAQLWVTGLTLKLHAGKTEQQPIHYVNLSWNLQLYLHQNVFDSARGCFYFKTKRTLLPKASVISETGICFLKVIEVTGRKGPWLFVTD